MNSIQSNDIVKRFVDQDIRLTETSRSERLELIYALLGAVDSTLSQFNEYIQPQSDDLRQMDAYPSDTDYAISLTISTLPPIIEKRRRDGHRLTDHGRS